MVFLLLGISVQAQTVSKTVTDQFNKLYATATEVEWGEDENSNFTAYFYLGTYSGTATFAKNGTWIVTSLYIDEDGLTTAIKETLLKKFGEEFMYFDIERTETPTSLQFKVELESDEETSVVVLDKDGKIISQK